MINYDEFEKWVYENDLLYKNFVILKDTITEYLNKIFDDNYNDLCENVYKNFEAVLAKCDEITYNENGVPEAYIILHFLDRYHRFQMIFMDMLKKGCFPIKEKVCLMDVGTGPGPSLFAFSDMVVLIQRYEAEKIGQVTIDEVVIDYVEQSNGFRQFLHMVTEFLLMKKEKCYVPFHHGNYYNAEDMQFLGWREIETGFFYNNKNMLINKYMLRAKKSFDMIIYSNFLTNIGTVKKFEKQIKNAIFYTKNKGVLVVVGGNPTNDKYIPVYDKLDEIVLKQKYCNNIYKGNCVKIIETQEMSYSGNCRYVEDIRKFYQNMIDKVTKNDWSKLEVGFKKRIRKYITTDKDEKWFLTVFRRHSVLSIKGKHNIRK